MRTVNPTVVCGRTVVCAQAVCVGTGFESAGVGRVIGVI